MAVIALPRRSIRPRRGSRWGCVGLLFVLVLACCGGQGIVAWQQYGEPQPSARALGQRFVRQRAQFEQLRGFLEKDRTVQRITAVWSLPEGQLSAARWKAYRELFAALGLAGGVERQADGGILFIATLRALGGQGRSSGIAYRAAPPPALVADLDSLPQNAPAGTYYQEIEGGWYVFVTQGAAR